MNALVRGIVVNVVAGGCCITGEMPRKEGDMVSERNLRSVERRERREEKGEKRKEKGEKREEPGRALGMKSFI